MMRGDNRQRGIALALVLWLIVVLGAVATSVVMLARTEGNVVRNLRVRAAARYAAESGIITAKAQLEDLLRGAVTLERRARAFRTLESELSEQDDQALDAGESIRFKVVFADVSARIDLNNADEPLLVEFFQEFVGERQARTLVDALLDWRDSDSLARPLGAEAAQYAALGSPFRPPNRPLQRLDELTRIQGFSDTLASLVAPYVTIYGDGRINLNSAPETVLAAVPGIGQAGARLLAEERARGTIFETPAIVWSLLRRTGTPWGAVNLGTLTTVPQRVLIISRGWDAKHPLTHEIQALYDVGATLTLRGWMERDL